MKRMMSLMMLFLINSMLLQAAEINFLDLKSVKLGEPVADFELKDTEGNAHKLTDHQGKVVVIHFWSAKCPFVLRYDDALKAITADYQKDGVVVLGIASNTNEPAEEIKKVAQARQVNYPVLLDPGHKIADQFGAVTTPHVYVINPEGKLVYEGAVDDQGWSEAKKPGKVHVRNAIEQTLKGETVSTPQTKSVGCTIKRF